MNVVDELDDPYQKISYIDSIIASPYYARHDDTLALLYFEKSNVYFRNNLSINDAIVALDDGLDLINEQDHQHIWIKLWTYKGYWYRKWDKYEEAKQALTNALKYTDNNPYAWEATIQLGKTYKDRGEFSLAIDIYQQAIRLAGRNQERLASTYEVIAFVYLIMETEEGARQAIPWLERLLSLLDTMPDREHFIASMTYNLGTAYLTLNDNERAITLFNSAESIIQSCCEDPDFESLLMESRALIYADQGKYDEALSLLKKSLTLFQQSFDLTRSDGISSTYRNIASTYFKKGDVKNAILFNSKAISIRLAGIESGNESISDISDHLLRTNGEKHYLIEELLLQGQLFKALYQETQNIKHLENGKETLLHADRLVDMMRFEHIENTTKEFWREKTLDVYQALVATLYMLNDCESAFYYSEKAKYLLMGEHLVRDENLAKNEDHSANIRAFRNVRIDIESTEVAFYTSTIKKEKHLLDSLKNKLIELKREEDDLLSMFQLTEPAFFDENFNFSIANIADIQNRLLQPKQTLIEYMLTDSVLFTFIIHKDGFDCIQSKVEIGLTDRIDKMREAIVSPYRNGLTMLRQYANHSYELYQQFIGAISHLMTEDVIIVTDPKMAHIPFAILLTDSIPDKGLNTKLKSWPYVMNRYNLSYQNSASLGLQKRSRQQSTKHKRTLLGIFPSYGGLGDDLAAIDFSTTRDSVMNYLPSLLGSQDELNFVKKIFKGLFFERENASESQFKQAISEAFAICHISGHAIMNAKNPEYSRLLLDDGDNEDGDLYAYEISNMDIQSELVILSACNTGTGKEVAGEGIASLGKAFAQAGSPNLLLSLWAVSDRATSSLIREYYGELINGQDKRTALRSAKSNFLANVEAAYHHPYYWGGFVYYGDDLPIHLEFKKRVGLFSPFHFWLASLVGILTIFGWWFRSFWRRVGVYQ